MSGAKRILLYALYTAACLAVFLYALFPEEPIKRYMEGRFAQAAPGIRLDIERVRPSLPLGVGIHHAFILQQDDPVALVEKVRLSPDLFSLFRPSPAITVSAESFGGRFSGKAVFRDRSFDETPDVSGKIEGMRLESIHALKQVSRSVFTGRIDGRIGGADSGSREPDVELTLSDVTVKLADGFMGIGDLFFSRCTMAADLEQNRLNVTNAEMRGRQFDVNAAGSIAFLSPVGETRLALSGGLIPHPELMSVLDAGSLAGSRKRADEGIGFSVSGTLGNPVFRWR